MQNYATLQENHDNEEQGILFHTAEPLRSKWNHVEDLDSFFTRVYKYHQRHGFLCMLLQEMFELHQYVFVVVFTTYLIYGINYAELFPNDEKKRSFSDIVLPPHQLYQNLTALASLLLVIAFIIWILKFLMKSYQMILFWDIKQFYNQALNIPDGELDNVTWCEIQTRIKFVQMQQQICIHKREINELDIYHRILRQENYLVAMVNKKLLPSRFNLPIFGEIIHWSNGLRYNIQGLLFWTPWSPFERPWHLKEEYKRQNLRYELANRLGRQILWLALFNLILAPVILVWQFLLTFFSYGELIKREPGRLGVRKWSPYAKLYLRHFNELDHELHARLTRAYRPASKYLQAFNSPLMAILAEHIAFICGSIFIVFIVYALVDESALKTDNYLLVMTVLGAALPICRSFIPDESVVWCPETLLQCVVMHTHYLPNGWQGQAHTSKIREEFQQLFQFRFVAVLEALLSPILTPVLLVYWVYPRSLEIVDFFRNFTVSVVGVGDVCSFAQMDIKRHGNPSWHIEKPTVESVHDYENQAEQGKTELSLMHFAMTNPDWEPPEEAREYVEKVQGETVTEAPGNVRAYQSFLESSSLGGFDPESIMQLRQLSLAPPDIERRLQRVSIMEGPDLMSSINLRNSVITMHNINERHQSQGSTVETTPLLGTRP